MYISKFQLFNYKSFRDSGFLELKPGINIIVGQNNSGKTAFIETLTLHFSNEPHRSLKTLPTPSSRIESVSKAEITLSFTRAELITLIDKFPSHSLGILQPSDNTLAIEPLVSTLQEWLDSTEPAELTISLSAHDNLKPSTIQINNLVKPVYFQLNAEDDFNGLIIDKRSNFFYIDKRDNGEISLDLNTYSAQGRHYLPIALFKHFLKRIYRLNAERSNLGSCFFGHNSELKPNASNLAEVLNVLQNRGKQKLFKLLNQYVSIIFPDLREVDVHPKKINITNDSELEIRVWSREAADNDREDLSFPLSACGTGIGQVLAILYVVITAQEPQIIIIDEPQSFLHPGAAKKLVEILKEFPQHQYFIATHSPQIISTANPSTIVQLRYEDNETKLSVMNLKETTQLRSLLAEVGISLSDVFGADNILWVEGPTEERCFPLLLEKVAQKYLRGTQILAVKNTGDLEGKRAHIIFDIYNKLSGSNSLFPPAIGFVFDLEVRSKTNIEDFKRRSENLVEFLPRRMYENYLLHPEAIAAVINEEDKYREQPLTSIEIEKWLNLPLSDSEWFCNVDGANLLKKLFSEFSETRVEFSKTKHSFEITKWLVENNPDFLSDLAEFLQNVLNRKQKAEQTKV